MMASVVVGVDGSSGSKAALTWAANEAALRGATLHIVHVYEPPSSDLESIRESFKSPEHAEQVWDGPLRAAEALLARLSEGLEGVSVEAHAVESNNAARVLVERSRGADMLVVSSRGHGGFKQLMLGSVSQQCAHHAECPVLIIRAGIE